jgi:hypothetical protein
MILRIKNKVNYRDDLRKRADTRKESCKNQAKSSSRKQFSSIISEINWIVALNLKEKKSVITKCRIAINKAFKDFIRDQFQISKRFVSGHQLLSHFEIIRKSYLTNNDYFQIKPDSFVLKIDNQRSTHYLDSELNKIKLEKKPSITIKFTRERVIQLHQEDENFLQSYTNKLKSD